MANTSPTPAATPGKKTVIKVQASLADIHNIRLMDTDLVIVLKSGKTAVVPDGAIRAMMDPEFTLQFDDTEVAGSALLRQAGRMEIGDLASVAVSTPPPDDAAVWLNGGPSPVAEATGTTDPLGGKLGALSAPEPKGFSERWGPLASIVAAGGALLAVAMGSSKGHGGSSSSTASMASAASAPAGATADPFSVFGTITAGPVLPSNDLRVEVRDTSGRVLGASTVDANGRYQINGLNGAYAGPLLVTVFSTGGNVDYVDVATHAGKDLASPLRAAAVRGNETQLQVNVTAVTELAVRVLAPTDGKLPADSAAVTHANTALPRLLGLGDSDITASAASPVILQDGSVSSHSNDYGRVLALLSGAASTDGGVEAAMSRLLGLIDTSGTDYQWKAGAPDQPPLSAQLALAFNALPGTSRTDELRVALNKALGASGDTIAPVMRSVTLTGVDSHGDDKTGKLVSGDKVRVTLSTDESMLVVGSPTLGLDLGGHTVQAAYTATTADGRLVFEYDVQPTDYAASGTISVVGVTADDLDKLVDADGNALAIALPVADQPHPIAVGTVLPVVGVRVDAADDTGIRSDDGITQSSLLHVSLSGSVGNTVHLFEDLNDNGKPDDGEALGEALIPPGAREATLAITLQEGRHALLAYQQDADGLTGASSAPFTVVVDNSAPVGARLQLAGPDQVTRGGTPFSLVAHPSFSITAEKGSQVSVFEDRNGDGVQNDDEPTLLTHLQTGSMDTVESAVALGDGMHPLRILSTDAAGNRSVSDLQTIGVATTPPPAPRVGLLPQEDSGAKDSDGITSKSLLHLQVSGEPGNTVFLFDDLNGNGQLDDGELIGQGPASAQAGTPVSLPASLAEGRHALMAYQQDDNGFTSDLSTPQIVVVDKTAPAQATLALGGSEQLTVNGLPVSLNAMPTFELTAEKGARVLVFEDLNGDGVQGADEQTLAEHTQLGGQDEVDSDISLSGGRHDLRVITTDAAGNRSVSDIQTIGILSKPIATSSWTLAPADDTGDRADDLITSRSTLHAQVSGDAGNTVYLFDDLNGNGRQDDGELLASAPVQDGEAQAALVFSLAEGSHVLRAYQQDVNGLSGNVSAPRTVVIDRTAPAVGKPELGGPDSTTLNGVPVSTSATPLFEITADKGSRVSVFEDLNSNGQIDAGERTLIADHLQIGARDEIASAVALADGSYELRVLATDVAGNRSVSAIQTLSVAASAPIAPTLGLAAADDTGDSSSDLLTNKRTVSIEVDGTAGTTVKLFNDFNQNGKEDVGESAGSIVLSARDAHGSGAVQLIDGVNHLHAYTVDSLGRKSAAGADLAITLDQQAPAAPTVQLAVGSDTGMAGDQVTTLESVALEITGAAGARFDLFDDRNGNGVMDAGELVATGALTGSTTEVQVSLHEGVHALGITAHDPAGNVSATTPYTLTVNHSLPTFVAARTLELDGRALANADANDGLLPNTPLGGERLTAEHLGLSDPAPAEVLVTFGQTTNVTLSVDGVTLASGGSVSLQQVMDGHVGIAYSQDNASLQSGGVFASADFDVSKPGATTDTASGSLNFGIHHDGGGIVAYGDGSGYGHAGSNNNTDPTFTAQAGSAQADQLLGTSQGDLIFGDGSGGGAGASQYAGFPQRGGQAGGANDVISGGDGNDVLFGDGFSGSDTTSTAGAGGYGGGGGGGNGRSYYTAGVGGLGGVGAGDGGTQEGSVVNGQPNTLGVALGGGAGTTRGSFITGGGGASVGGGTTQYTAEFDGAQNAALHQYDNTGSADSAIAGARAAFLDGPGGSNGENRLFTQRMGVGNDTIDGGAGDDAIMAGNGDDVIIGGRGNDILYGRGGSAAAGTDNDLFAWHRGDAGTTGAIDVIRDFGASDGNQDRLSLLPMLEGRAGPADDLSAWIKVFNNAAAPAGVAGADAGTSGALIVIDVDGDGPGHALQQIYLSGVTLATTDVQTLISNGTVL